MEFHLQFLRENDGRVMDLDLNRQVAAAKTTACNVHLELLHTYIYQGVIYRAGGLWPGPLLFLVVGEQLYLHIVCGRVHRLVLGMQCCAGYICGGNVSQCLCIISTLFDAKCKNAIMLRISHTPQNISLCPLYLVTIATYPP